jgi:hypothetical protein
MVNMQLKTNTASAVANLAQPHEKGLLIPLHRIFKTGGKEINKASKGKKKKER